MIIYSHNLYFSKHLSTCFKSTQGGKYHNNELSFLQVLALFNTVGWRNLNIPSLFFFCNVVSGHLQGSLVPSRWEEMWNQIHASCWRFCLWPQYGDWKCLVCLHGRKGEFSHALKGLFTIKIHQMTAIKKKNSFDSFILKRHRAQLSSFLKR